MCIQELKNFRTRLDSSQFASSDVILNMLMSYRDIQVSFRLNIFFYWFPDSTVIGVAPSCELMERKTLWHLVHKSFLLHRLWNCCSFKLQMQALHALPVYFLNSLAALRTLQGLHALCARSDSLV